MHIPFSKYSGCGNDFILIDNRQQVFDTTRTESIVHLCHRRLGIGADGIVLLESSSSADADFRMRIFNADGGEAEMCGNGLRCLVRFIQELGVANDAFLIETMHQLIPTRISGEYISADMPAPTDCHFFDKLTIEETSYTLHCLDTGVPHAVIFVDDLQDSRLMAVAPEIRYHPHFMPKGTNVNFAAINSNNEVEVRTYERGVEGETLACGTGAAAVAVVAACVHGLSSPIAIRPKSGETIYIAFPTIISRSSLETAQSFDSECNEPKNNVLTMTGPAVKIFSGLLMTGLLTSGFAPMICQKSGNNHRSFYK